MPHVLNNSADNKSNIHKAASELDTYKLSLQLQ